MSRISILLALPLYLLFLGGVTQAQEAPKKVVTVEGVSEYKLANGARVLLFPDASKPTITVNMTVLVGSRHEGYGEAGMAHLLEHMVFKGTPEFPDIPTALRDHGASFNGTTNRDRTNYFETLPASQKNLKFAVEMESSRLVESFIKHEDLQSEFTVVRNEFERGENSPQGVLSRRVMAAAYEWHNYGKTTIGNRSDIERVPIDNLRAFYRKYYQPDNVVMIVAGDFETEKALGIINSSLGAIPKPKRELPRTYTEEPAQDGERFVYLNRVGEIGSVMAAYHVPSASHDDWAPLSVLGSIISEAKVGLLEQELVEKSIATRASARADNAHDPGLFTVSVSPREGMLEDARATMVTTMDSIGSQKFDIAAIDRAKMRSKRSAEDMMTNASRVASSLSSASSLGDWRLMFVQRDRMQAVTLEDVQRVAAKYFPPHNRTIGMFVPTETARRMEIPIVASINDVVKDYKGGDAIEAGEAFDASPANLETRLATVDVNGLNVGMIKKENRGDTVNMTITFRYGNENSLNDNTLAAGMINSMLMAGTTTMDRQALQARMSEMGVRFGGGRGRGRRGRGGGGGGGSAGALSFSIQAKSSSLVPAIELLGEIMNDPAFPEDEFEQMQTRRLNMMKMMANEPSVLAGMELSRAMSDYPKGDIRYVPNMEETVERLEGLTLDQIKKIYREQLSGSTGEVAIVGDFEPAIALDALKKITDRWSSDVEYQPIVRNARKDMTGDKIDINTPDKANATWTSGLAFEMDQSNADCEALMLGNFILGGGTLSSRLGNRIRQKEGLSYGVTSSVSIPNRGNDARFRISAITNPVNIEAVETAAMEELKRFIDEGPTEQEVEDAVVGWLERAKVSRAADGSIAGSIISNLNLDRTFAFTAQREKKIAALTAADIQDAFKRNIAPENLVIIRAGDFGK